MYFGLGSGALLACATRMRMNARIVIGIAIALLSTGNREIHASGLGQIVGDKQPAKATSDAATLEQAKVVRRDLLLIDIAVNQFTIDHNRMPGHTMTVKE